MVPRVALLALFTLGLTREALGQRLAPNRFASFPQPSFADERFPARNPQLPDPSAQPNIGAPVLAGAVGGALGLVGGFIVGAELGGGDRLCGDDPCGLVSGFLGAMIGEMVLLPVGVHLGNGRRGSFAEDLAASLGAGLVGALLLGGGAGDEPLPVVLVAGGQLAATVAIERHTRRRN